MKLLFKSIYFLLLFSFYLTALTKVPVSFAQLFDNNCSDTTTTTTTTTTTQATTLGTGAGNQTTTDPYDWLFNKITTQPTTTRSVKKWPRRMFKLQTMHPMCGQGRPVPFDYQESVQLLENKRNDNKEIPIVAKAISQEQYPWTAVIYPDVDNLPMLCYGVIVDDDLVLTTRQCLNTLTMASNKQTLVIRAGLQQAPLLFNTTSSQSCFIQSITINITDQSHDLISNNKSLSEGQSLLSVINITSTTANSTRIEKFNFTTGHVRPICVAESRRRCEQRCRPGFTSYIVGGRNLFSNLTAPSQVYRGLTLQPSDPYTPLSSSIVVDDQSQWREGSHLAILRNVKSQLCGLVDASQAFLPICDYYDYFVGKNREDVWFDNLV